MSTDTLATDTLKAEDLSVTLTANDAERTIRFYTDGLGFTVKDRMETAGKLDGAMLGSGRVTLAISQDDFSKGRDRTKGVGMGMHLVSVQDLAAIVERLKAAGIALESPLAPLPWGPMGFTVRDPDGFRVTVANPA